MGFSVSEFKASGFSVLVSIYGFPFLGVPFLVFPIYFTFLILRKKTIENHPRNDQKVA